MSRSEFHTLVLGTTGAGKSTYCKWLSHALNKNRKHVVVFNPRNQSGWSADFQSANPYEIRKYCERNNIGEWKYVFIEEASYLKKDDDLDYFTTYARNDSCKVWIICQRLKMVTPNLRSNCEEVILFKSALSDCAELADEYREPGINEIKKFEPGQFYVISAFHPLLVSQLDWQRKNWPTPKIVEL